MITVYVDTLAGTNPDTVSNHFWSLGCIFIIAESSF